MCGRTARLTRWVPRTLTSYCWAYCSGVKASAGPNIIWPALCTTTSMRPLGGQRPGTYQARALLSSPVPIWVPTDTLRLRSGREIQCRKTLKND
jgi:hypothetical protein